MMIQGVLASHAVSMIEDVQGHHILFIFQQTRLKEVSLILLTFLDEINTVNVHNLSIHFTEDFGRFQGPSDTDFQSWKLKNSNY